MSVLAIRKVYSKHAREHLSVQLLIALAGLTASVLMLAIWPVFWAAAIIGLDTLRVARYKALSNADVVSSRDLTALGLFGAICQCSYLVLPIILTRSDDPIHVMIAIIMICGAALRQTHEFAVSRGLGLCNWLPYVTLPSVSCMIAGFGQPFDIALVHFGVALALASFAFYCLIFWQSIELAEQKLEAERAEALRQRDKAAVDAALAMQLFESSVVIAALFDTDGRILAINDTGLRATGKPREAVIGLTMGELIADCPPVWLEASASALEGVPTRVQADRLVMGGLELVLDWDVRPWRKADGTIGGAAAYIHDVTKAHRAHEAERARTQRLDLALKASRAFIWEVDYATRTVDFDEAAVTFFGSEPVFEMFEPSSGLMVHPDDLESRDRQAALIAANGGYGRMEHRHVLADGSVRWVRSDVAPAAGQPLGWPTRFVMLTRDATEEMARQEELAAIMAKAELALIEKRNLLAELDTGDVGSAQHHDLRAGEPRSEPKGTTDKLFAQLDRILSEIDARDVQLASVAIQLRDARERAESASHAKSQFLANMSHELRTPLNAIIGYAEIIQEDLEPAGLAVSVSDAGKIRSSALHLLDLINEVLDLSKIEAGRMDICREPVDLAALASDIVAASRPLAQSNGNVITLEVGSVKTVTVSDPLRLRQCLLNLISNACKFTRNGSVTVKLERTAMAGTGDQLEIAVSDTGVGIAPEALTRLFKPFSQADETTTREYGGTGLGLAITRDMARLLGGDVAVTSRPGSGSTFVLCIPCVDDDAAADASAGGASNKAGGVLMLGAPGADQQKAEGAACALGLNLTVTDSWHALAGLVRACKPGLILLDLDQPDLDCAGLVAAIRSDRDHDGIPLVAMSSNDDRAALIAAGAQEHLVKPCTEAALTAAFARLARHRTPAPTFHSDFDDMDVNSCMRAHQ
jgi:PAS domain S-box-containing protein